MGSSAKLLAAAGLVGILAGLGLSFAAPSRYISQAVLLVAGPPTPQARVDLIHSLAERAWPRIVLARIIEDFDLYKDAASSSEDVVSQMRNDISAVPLDARKGGGDSEFAIRFGYSDPAAAQKVAANLTQRLLDENQRGEALGIPAAHLQVISPASLPRFPAGPNRLLLSGEGLVAGLIAGALLASRKRRRAAQA